jgi:RHS repeat-associated protein
MYYYRGRHYDPRIGRFIQRDPIGMSDDVNLYRYVGNNPMNYNDPFGRCSSILPSDDIIKKIFEQ